MAQTTTVSAAQLAAALIACLEGVRLTAYQDSGGVWTIGVGHTGPDVHEGMTVTPQMAAYLFAQDSRHLLEKVADCPIFQAVALVSFGYNVGMSAMENVIAGKDQITNPAHTKDRHGNVLTGLVNRRNLENLLFQLDSVGK